MQRMVLVVDDEQNMQTVMRMILEEAGYIVEVADSGEAGLAHLTNPNLDVVLSDLKMPGMGGEEFIRICREERPDVPVVVVTAHGTIRSAVQSINAGASDYLTKPFEPEELGIAVHSAVKLHDVLHENLRLRETVTESQARRRLMGTSEVVQRLLDEIKRVAPYRTGVLITGESGTGKELVARTIHETSTRHDRPWVAINCSAIPHDLMESELFGYVKGAFTGAAQNRLGRLEQAQGGTLFLDEIADLAPALQAKLLRVLQEREFFPVGSDQVRSADVRFLAATNRDLKGLVRQGSFREDLFYRLDVYSIVVPPLRDRGDDIVLLAESFLRDISQEMDKPVQRFTQNALQVLLRYRWPGNVRELRNAVERSVLSCKGREIDVPDLPEAIRGATIQSQNPDCVPERVDDQDLDSWLADVERRAILSALEHCGGIQAHAARRLGISERSLWHRIKKLNIQVNRSFT
ncbi:MAG: sigma-54-dependent transcriptional regulator [Acidiferrobacterales bacterium]